MNPRLEPSEDESDAPIASSIRRHLGWQSLFEIAGSVGAPAAFVIYKFWSGETPEGVANGIAFFGLFIVGYLVPRAVFRHWIGAACPASDCRGKVFPEGTNPVVYVCRSCRCSYDSGVSEGDDGQIGPAP